MKPQIVFILLMAILFPVVVGQGFNWENDPQKSKITIRHLATHSSGIEDSEVSVKDRAEAKAKGIWDGKQLIRSEWVERVTAYAGTPLPPRGEKIPSPACGLAWYNNFDGIWPRAPRDLFLGSGAGNQTLIVIPSMNTIVVRNGENMYDPETGEGHFYGVVNHLVNMLMDACIEPPYPGRIWHL